MSYIIKLPNLLERIRRIPQLQRKKEDENYITGEFLHLYNQVRNTDFKVISDAEFPDVICRDTRTGARLALELREIALESVKKERDATEKIRETIRKGLDAIYDGANLPYGFRLDLHLTKPPSRNQLDVIRECTANEFSKFFLSGEPKLEIRYPVETVELLRLQKHDYRKQVLVLVSGLNTTSYLGKQQLTGEIATALASKDAPQAYEKNLLLYFPYPEWEIVFEKQDLLCTLKEFDISKYSQIRDAFLLYSVDNALEYFDFRSGQIVTDGVGATENRIYGVCGRCRNSSIKKVII